MELSDYYMGDITLYCSTKIVEFDLVFMKTCHRSQAVDIKLPLLIVE